MKVVSVIEKSAYPSFRKISECPVCQESEALEVKFNLTYFSDEVIRVTSTDSIPAIELLTCKRCGHNFSSYILTPEVLDNYYTKISSIIYKDATVESIDTHAKERKWQALEIEDYCPEGGDILDVGCGSGFLLKNLDKKKWRCYGVEPSVSVSEIARKNGIHILGQYINEISPTAYTFDLIVLFDVMEHLSDPQQMIQQIYGLLKKGGSVVIITGNIGSLNASVVGSQWSYFNSYEHISFFNPASMRFLLSKHNFKEVHIKRISYELGLFKNSFNFLKNIIRYVLKILHLRKVPMSPLAFDHMLVFAKK